MEAIIDTSILISAERGKIDLDQYLQDIGVYISTITITELLVGVNRATTSERRLKRSVFVENIISSITSLPFGAEEARVYSQILDDLYKRNITIDCHDLLIASTAIANNLSLLTLNIKDFERISALEILNVNLIK